MSRPARREGAALDTGHNRKTDALEPTRSRWSRCALRAAQLAVDGDLEALRMLADRRDELAHLRVQTVNRLQRLFRRPFRVSVRGTFRTAGQAILAGVRPRTRREDPAPDGRREIADLVAVDAKLKKIKAELEATSSPAAPR